MVGERIILITLYSANPQVSYKGLKDKNISDVRDFLFHLPTLEYHSQTWTWHDLLMAMKADSKKVLISQVRVESVIMNE